MSIFFTGTLEEKIMKSITTVIILFVSCMIEINSAHAFGRPRPTPTPVPAPIPAYHYSEQEIEGIQLINQHRLSMGLGSVTQNDFISNECLKHENYMIQKNVPSHDYFTDRANAIELRLNAKYVGENVAYNYNTPQSVVTAWLNSPGHRANIETPKFKRVGYSVRANSSGRNFYTMIFSD